MSWVERSAAVQKQLADEKTHLCLLIDELFAQVPEAILLVDKASWAVRVNWELVGMFGYLQEQVICETVVSLIVPEGLRKEAGRFVDLIAQGQHVSVGTVRMRKDGQRIDIIFAPRQAAGVPLGPTDSVFVLLESVSRSVSEE